jgi:hypothetical protein
MHEQNKADKTASNLWLKQGDSIAETERSVMPIQGKVKPTEKYK